MKFLTALFAIVMSLTLVTGQRFFFGQFGVPTGGLAPSRGNIRDPRQNRGPVLFPQPPTDAIDETSGVVVGASGFGFVPPQQNQNLYNSPLHVPASSFLAYNYFNNPFAHRFSYF